MDGVVGAGRDGQGVSVREGIVVVLNSRVTAMGQCISLVKKNPGPSRAAPLDRLLFVLLLLFCFVFTNQRALEC